MKYISSIKKKELYHQGVKGMKWRKHLTNKEIDQAADDTISGKYGNGQKRKDELGDHYDKIQSKVNEKLKNKNQNISKTSLTKNDIEKLAKQVINGKYGNGNIRKKKLGKNYKDIQSRVNVILKKSKSNRSKK